MKSKTNIITEAIQNKMYIAFDYVSTTRKISIGRLVKPVDLLLTDKHGMKLWAIDTKEGLLKQFDLEGIQEPRVIAITEGGKDETV